MRTVKHALAGMHEDPLGSRLLKVVLNGVEKDSSDRLEHHALDLTHPVLDSLIAGVDRLCELDFFLLS